jgi:N-acetylmuramoyl-L-alanine amidase
MKRFLLIASLIALAIASIVVGQVSNQATLRTPAGDKPITFIQQGGQAYVSANEVIGALGGTIQPDSTGFKVVLNNNIAAFGPDTRFAVVKDDIIEMPVAPIVVAGAPFVPWQFFQGFLAKAADQEALWDGAGHVLIIRARQQSIVTVQMTVTNVQGISKIVLTLSAPSDYSITKEPNAYVIHFKAPLQAPFAEQAYEDPYVAHASFAGSDLRIQLTSAEVAGDAYKLDNPFRIILDLRKVSTPAGGTTSQQQLPGIRPAEPSGIRTIVIDPGHGGKDVGAAGPGGLMEKDVTLAVARKLSAALQSKINARVVLTREDDSLVSLDQRTAIANLYHADLFLSVHMNAAVVKGAKGSETYFLSLEASDEVARRAAETENASTSAAKANPSADLKLILWDLAQQEYLQESSRFAQDIQEEMNRATGVQNRGVKQAPFKVLVGATMPAALVEVGFITNPAEEDKLKSDNFQDMMVEALVRAVERYKTDYETRIGLIQPVAPLAGVTKAAPPLVKGRSGT